MDWWLSEEQQLVQDSFRDFLASECSTARVRRVYDSDAPIDETLWRDLQGLGFAGTCIPVDGGGAGLGLMEAALLSEELGRHIAPLFLEGHILAGLAIARGGSAAQRDRLLPALASGESIGTLALSDQAAGKGDASWQVTAGGSDTVTLELVPVASVADVFVIGCIGGQLGLLETNQADITVTDARGVDRSRKIYSITFEESALESLPGMAGDSLCDALATLLAADAYGAASSLLERTVEYANTREQFGQQISQFQAVKHQLAEFALGTVSTRGLYWKAARGFDTGHKSAARSASLAKAHITDHALKHAKGAVELHGGTGFTWESDVHLFLKRLVFDRNFLGSPEYHRERCAELAEWAA